MNQVFHSETLAQSSTFDSRQAEHMSALHAWNKKLRNHFEYKVCGYITMELMILLEGSGSHKYDE